MFFKKFLMVILIMTSAEAGSVSSTMAIPQGTYLCRAFQNDEIVFEQGLVILANNAIDIKNHRNYKAQSRVNNKDELLHVIDEPLVAILIFKNQLNVDQKGKKYYGAGFQIFPHENAQTYSKAYYGSCHLIEKLIPNKK